MDAPTSFLTVKTHFAILALAAAPLCAAADDFPAPYNSEAGDPSLSSPAEALAALKLPDGFRAALFANEPDVQNPIAMAWDHRGRMWVAENFTYAERPKRFDLGLRDRVIIFEDKDNDGRAESRKVFTDNVQMLTSVEVGRGGVWLMCPPQLLFIPDRNGDDVPDGPPEVMLDGFTVAQDNYHNFANGLHWGPDGWLYGRCGHSCPGRLGVPGTPDAARVPIKGGVWRFHPERKVVEVLTHGTTNPWGHDWDKHGEGFFINTVTGHLWHLIPGAHLVDSNPSLNPGVYERLDSIADHWHFDKTGGRKALSDGTADSLGGGHAHIGMMIYQADQWPQAFRDKLFTLNMHGRRTNMDRLERHGSSYIGRHEPDVFPSADPWFRGLEISTGPDGSGYILDWSDVGECHEATGVHRTSGRIFKITHGTPQSPSFDDLAKLTTEGAERLLRNPNVWFERQCRRQIAEGSLPDGLVEMLNRVLNEESDPVLQLRALWSLNLTGKLTRERLVALLHDKDEHLRVWAIRLLTDRWPIDCITGPMPGAVHVPDLELTQEFETLARSDSSGLVRLTLTSALQRLPVSSRPAIAAALVARKEDATDAQLPLMVWFGLIPVSDSSPAALLEVARACEWPSTLKWITRSLASRIDTNPAPLNALLSQVQPGQRESVLAGISEALQGWRKATKPEAWDRFAASVASQGHDRALRDLSAVFGDGRALDALKEIVMDTKADLSARQSALKSLIDNRPPDLRAICESLLDERFLNATAVRGLALFDDPDIGTRLAASYRKFFSTERPGVMEVLVSRPAFAKPLLEQIATGNIPRVDLTVFHARQIRSLNDAALTRRLTEAWGELRESSGDKQKLIADLKGQLTAATLAEADLSQGRLVFQGVCSACHSMYGNGGKIGPDLTGSDRANLDYLLENMVDPSAVVSADYCLNIITLKDGRVLGGIIAAQTERTLTVRLLTEETTVEKKEIVKQEASPVSMMPDGLLSALSREQVRDLIAYLMHPVQVPFRAASK
jgi:putative membrane-bound dehydrogenase-like protein